uniref:Transcriptional regulator n=1 Tax=Streptoalloteichus sp. ATCC 53650 TaxID=756733 RepID=K4NYL4_9PSEU|nr:transcriptional regulator [Streptoalloteichus sp. ATCC 53650]
MMHERYLYPITINDISAAVFVSPFHFSRTFSKFTGVAPGRYLTAVRLFEAKRLLLTTDHTVSNIVCSVGYSSVGTFTSRFSRSVGMTPTQYRDPLVGDLLVSCAPHFQHLAPLDVLLAESESWAAERQGGGTVSGRLELPASAGGGHAVVGLFDELIPQRGPVAFTAVPIGPGTSEVVLDNVPPGRWYVLAAAEHVDGRTGEKRFAVGHRRTPIKVVEGGSAAFSVPLRASRPTDPPIAVTLARQSDLGARRPLCTVA